MLWWQQVYKEDIYLYIERDIKGGTFEENHWATDIFQPEHVLL